MSHVGHRRRRRVSVLACPLPHQPPTFLRWCISDPGRPCCMKSKSLLKNNLRQSITTIDYCPKHHAAVKSGVAVHLPRFTTTSRVSWRPQFQQRRTRSRNKILNVSTQYPAKISKRCRAILLRSIAVTCCLSTCCAILSASIFLPKTLRAAHVKTTIFNGPARYSAYRSRGRLRKRLFWAHRVGTSRLVRWRCLKLCYCLPPTGDRQQNSATSKLAHQASR